MRMDQELGIGTGFVSFEEARRIEPLLTPPQGAAIVYEPHSGCASPAGYRAEQLTPSSSR